MFIGVASWIGPFGSVLTYGPASVLSNGFYLANTDPDQLNGTVA